MQAFEHSNVQFRLYYPVKLPTVSRKKVVALTASKDSVGRKGETGG